MTYTTTSRTLLTLCSFFLALTAYSQTTLVTTNSVFQYYDNGDQPADDGEGDAWYSNDYDATWSSFDGPLGYGAGDHNEILDPSANTVYFRHQWNIESTTDFDLMFLNLLYNDGAIIYLNGNIINRVNMPQGEVDYNTSAASNVEIQEMRNIALPHLFINGINTVAVEVHNAGDSNLSFGIEVIEYHEICEILGQPCNDLNSNTINDVINEDCECEGFACDIEAYAGEVQEIQEGQSATLEAQGGGTYFWSTGDTSNTIVVSPTSTTGYSVTVTDENGCEDFDDVMVNVIPCEVVAEAGDDVTIEINAGTLLTSSEASSYAWSTGENTRSIMVSPAVDQHYTVTITDENGCHAKDSVGVFLVPCFYDAPCDDGNAYTYGDKINEFCDCQGTPCVIEVDIAGNNTILLGESTTLVASGGTSYTWSNGMSTAEINVTPTQTTNYNVVVMDEHGCGDVASLTVDVREVACEIGEACNDNIDGTYDDHLNEDCECVGLPCHLDIDIGGDNTIVLGESTRITVEGGLNYIWENGVVGPVQVVSPEVTTTYVVNVIGANGCEDFVPYTIIVLPCDVGATCDDDSDGTYDDQLNEDCECIGTPCNMDIDIRGNNTIILGETSRITVEGGLNYIWDNGAIGPVQVVSPEETTIYVVNVIGENGCEDFVPFTVNVLPCEVGARCDDGNDGTYDDQLNEDCDCVGLPCQLDVDIRGDNSIVIGETSTITVEGGLDYIWDTGVRGPVIKVSPEETTIYVVNVIGENGCEDFVPFTVNVTGSSCNIGAECDDNNDNTYGDQLYEDCECTGFPCQMDVEIGGDLQISEGQLATIVAKGGVNYVWSNGMRGPVVDLAPLTTTQYTVTITDSQGCVEEASVTIEVIIPACKVGEPCNDFNDQTYDDQYNEECECYGFPCQMDIEIGGDLQISEGQLATIVAEGGVNYAWSNGMRGSVVDLAPLTTTQYTVTITDSNGCEEFGSVTVEVSPCTIGESCDDDSDGTYDDQLNVDCECVGVPCQIEVGITGDDVISLGETASIVAQGGLDFIWDNGAVGPNIIVSPTETTTYHVTAIADNGCEDFASFTVVVETCEIGSACDDGVASTFGDSINEVCDCVGYDCNMVIEIIGDPSIEEGQTASITAKGGIIYEWNNGMTGSTISVSPTTTTNYSVIVTDSNGCVDVASYIVEVIPLGCTPFIGCDDFNTDTYHDEINENCECIGLPCHMDVEIGGDNLIEIGQTATLTAGGGVAYFWSNGAVGMSIEVAPTETTTYTVVVNDVNGCEDEAEITVTVTIPEAECDVQATGLEFYSIIQGQIQTLSVGGGAYYEWSTGETAASIDVSPVGDITYDVAVFDSESCFEIIEIFVEVIADPACELGSECDDNNPLTTNDAIDENCQCVGEETLEGGQGEGAGSVVGGTSTTATDAGESTDVEKTESVETEVEDCTPITSFFPLSKLKHYGAGATVTQYEFANLQSGVSFMISGITAKLATSEKSKYIDVVDVSYINESGQEISYGTFSGEVVKEVEVNIAENIQKVIISLVDGYDGIAPKVSISLGNISSCSIARQGATAQNNGLQAAQQELIEVSLQSNLVNGRLMVNIDNPNASSQPIYAVVIDANGAPVLPDALSGEVLPGSQSEYIDIASLRPGLYYLKTQVGRQIVTLKFVVAE